MRVTLFGASGLLGQELVQELSGEQLTALSSKDADLRDRARVRDVIRDSRPDWILLVRCLHRRGWLRVQPRPGLRGELRGRHQCGRRLPAKPDRDCCS